MIFTERTVTVTNDNATINKPLILYRGDKNIELKITIAESQFKFRNTDASNVIETTDASYAQLVINTPYGSPIFSDVAATKNGAVIFVITEGMIDEIRELGSYSIQIRLLDDDKQSRATIPPVSNAIEIKAPIAIEDGSAIDGNTVNTAMAGYAVTTYSTPLESFDSQGNYIKTTWGEGDVITDAKLNKIEAGIEGVNNKISSIDASGVSIQDTANNFTSTNVEGALAELFQSVSSGKSLIASAITDKGVDTSNTATFQEMATNIGSISSTEGDNTQYSVTYILSNVVSSNTSVSVNAGNSYTTTLTANSGYQLNTPTITVDGLDVTSKYYSNGVFTINNVFGNIIITADATEVISSGGLTLNYTFNNETAGNGYGTISLLADSDDTAGDYIIQYADDNGALTNYDDICTLTATNGVQVNYTHFIAEQMIPKYATKIIAVKDDLVAAEFEIPEAKRFTSGNYGEHLYSFGAISDIHTGATTWDTDLQEAFTYLNEKESVVFTCAAGDVTDNGTETQFTNFKTIKDTYSPDTPFYSTNGNHEWYNSSFSDELWRTYIECDRTCIFTHGNDVFIMFGNQGTNATTCFTDEQKTWLETQLVRYANCRVFVFCHYFINGTDNGNFNNYYGVNVVTTSTANGQWILGLLQQYPNMFWFSGHSHMKFIVQELCSKITICNEYGGNELGYMVHLPSITNPREVLNGQFTDKLAAESEGAVIDVYENCILYRGRNFVDKKFIPIGQYILPKVQGILPDENTYVVYSALDNATSSNTAAFVDKNSSYTTRITANDGYLIQGITVKMGGTDVTSTVLADNVITIESVTGDISIIVDTIVDTNSGFGPLISNNLYQVTSSNTTTRVEEGETFTTTLTANGNCTLNHVRVTMGDEDVTDTAYNADTGVVTITNVTDNIIVNALALTSSQTACDITASNFVMRYGSPTVVDNENGSITVTFVDKGEQFYVTHDNLPASTLCCLYIEDVLYNPNITDDLKKGLGFILSDGTYGLTTGVELRASNSSGKIEFNCSNTKYGNIGGTVPVTITFRNCKLIVG